MADALFTKFFDKEGIDMNLGASASQVTVVYQQSSKDTSSLSGGLFFPVVSTGLIESQQLYILQEVTGPTSSFQLRKVSGSVTTTSGSSTIVGNYTDFTSLTGGLDIRIGDQDYVISSITGATVMDVSPVPSVSETTDDVYRYDYLSYTQPRSSIGTFREFFNVYFENEDQTAFFLYNIDYTEDVPYISKTYSAAYQLVDGSSDSIDSYSGRIQVADPLREPFQLNIGICSSEEDNYQENLKIDIERQYIGALIDVPVVTDTAITMTIGGTSQIPYIHSNSVFYLQGVTGASSTETFYEKKLTPKSLGITGTDTYIVFNADTIPGIPVGSLSSYRILWKNVDNFATLSLYGEVEGEDERFRLVLENFGRKIDFDKEYIFRESDINEALPDFRLLNKKRKELLLEGDNIYPYLGSYRSLINVINYFGYYDLDIKEYFLNVDSTSPNYDKFMQVLLPRNEEQRKLTKAIWEIVPSRMWKKTSYFGLFYDLNTTTGEYDEHGVPIVEDSFMFSPEEVLIKLFGLKQLLKEQFLPLNARIIDITGEGIYFERIRIDAWADNLNHRTINIGELPEFTISPSISYISDLRRIDQFYVQKFIDQGLTGFLGATTSIPYLSGTGATGLTVLSTLYPTSLSFYASYIDSPYDINGELQQPIDNTWDYMPPGVNVLNFNDIARRLEPLPDAEGIPAGAPILLEALFDVKWEEGSFNWAQLGILGPTGAPKNINLWTWDSIGRGQNIDCRWTIEKRGHDIFTYDSGRRPLSEFDITTLGATVFSIPAKMQVTSMTGSSIATVQITNSGYGYNSLPNVSILGTVGATATIEISLSENGYIVGGTVTFGGTGYTSSVNEFGTTLYPTIVVDPPAVQYETTTKTLHAVSLPYEGDYQIGLYLYDITNNFTVQFNKHTVNTRKAEFVSVHRKETSERTWEDFATPMQDQVPDHLSFGELPSSGARLIEWEEVTGPWYYPIHVFSTWEDAKISWESLDFNAFREQTLYEDSLNTSILEINRDNGYVILSGIQDTIDIGDSLFFVRNESDMIESNVVIGTNSIGNLLPVIVSGNIGATYVGISSPVSSTVSIGDSILMDKLWYTVQNIGSTSIYLDKPLGTTCTGNCVHYESTNLVPILGITTSVSNYTRALLTTNTNYESVDPTVDYYGYVDVISIGGTVYIKEDDLTIRSLMLKNSAAAGLGEVLYASWGMFSGTYTIEVKSKSVSGSNTRFNLKDVNKELYYLDGNFSISNSDYDVDYAEYRIGNNSLTYEAADETTWEDARPLSWFGLEYHSGVHCGYIIPFVAPGGSIRVDEFPSFQLSGDGGLVMIGITGAKSSLLLAEQELSTSTNEGIRKFDYNVLPETELYMTGLTGALVTVVSNVTNQIVLSEHPGNLKIPATVIVSLTGSGLAISVSQGYGYILLPTITIPTPDTDGTPATVVLGLNNSQVYVVSSTPGTGYTYAPEVTISYPENFKTLDNAIWKGDQWVKVEQYDYPTKTLYFSTTPTYNTIPVGSPLLLPYEYHKQHVESTVLQQFYFFIHAQAINPSSEMLCAISTADGVEGEWLGHPNRTCSYPLRNSLLFGALRGTDYLYQKWEYEGSDYPPLNILPDYSSDTQSIQSRIPYLQTLQSVYSFNDTVISNNQQSVPTFTPVVFNYDDCKIPGKTNPKWTITHEETGLIQAISKTKNFMWNFTKDGNYTVALDLEDANGNKSSLKKTSFIVIGKPEKVVPPIGRKQLKPVIKPKFVIPSINILANDIQGYQ